jgi:hypothetical protein
MVEQKIVMFFFFFWAKRSHFGPFLECGNKKKITEQINNENKMFYFSFMGQKMKVVLCVCVGY